MGADVIPFAPRPARPPRAASGAHARAEWWRDRHEQLSRERAAEEYSFWSADLETYPRKFQEVLDISMELSCHWSAAFDGRVGPDYLHRARQDVDRDYARLVDVYLERMRSTYREAAERRRNHPDLTPRNERRDEAVHELLGILWRRGRRQILRADLEPYAAKKVAEERADLERDIARTLDRLEQNRTRLTSGVFATGKRRGQALPASYLEGLQARIDWMEADLAKDRRRLAELDAEPDPMRASGIWPRRRRASRVDT